MPRTDDTLGAQRPDSLDMTPAGFHEGELAVQRRAGVEHLAARLESMLDRPGFGDGLRRFLAERDLAVLTGRDCAGRLWASPLTGQPGMLNACGTRLCVAVAPAAGDPLAGLPTGQPVGLLAIEFATRRRVRVNGTLTAADGLVLEIAVAQAYGNCPQYIQQRQLRPAAAATADGPARTARTPRSALGLGDAALIGRADTFFLGTIHPRRGADCSHRGGPPGVVRIDGPDFWWPDYPGNNMFNSLGNLAVDPTAALLFTDFITGAVLHLSGTAATDWGRPGDPGDDGGTGRRVRFTPAAVLAGPGLPLRAREVQAYPP